MENIDKVVVIDFDNTLFYTPEPEKGKRRYEAMTGEVYPHQGWWGRAESLDMDVMSIQPNEEIVDIYKECEHDPRCMTVLCTGRLAKLKPQVKEILKRHNIFFDQENFNPGASTLTYKLETLDRLRHEYPDAEIILYDDRDDHIPSFKEWAADKDEVEIVHVK